MKYYAIYRSPLESEAPYELYWGAVRPRSTERRQLIWIAEFNGDGGESFRKEADLFLLVDNAVDGLNDETVTMRDLPQRLTTTLGFVNPRLIV
ncbi:MAG: hypothetical protein AABY16_01695 [Nanoarchaeota archaeon]